MKTLARGYLWWRLIDIDIVSVVKECDMCQQRHKSQAASPLHPWKWPQEPWSRLHIDYEGPIRDKNVVNNSGCTFQIERRTYNQLEYGIGNNTQTINLCYPRITQYYCIRQLTVFHI